MLTTEAVPVMVRIMAPHIGETMASSAIEAHCRRLGIAGGSLDPTQVDALLERLRGGLNIFLGKEKAASVIAEVRLAIAPEEKR